MDDLTKMLAQAFDASIAEALRGPPRKQRQTAIRLRGRMIETVELDDNGKVIEPLRCICGNVILLHRPNCPFFGFVGS